LLCFHLFLFSQSLHQSVQSINGTSDFFSRNLNEKSFSATKQFNSFQPEFTSKARPDFLLGDTLPLPRANRLRNDDPAYNKRYSILIPLLEVPLINAGNWALDRYVQNASYAYISPETWKYNIQNGWVWDTDDFPTNFSGHPYGGSWYFNAARANGYNFYQSFPFTVYGSLMWEYFGENTQPSYNDLINTTITGAFLGETLYRLSSSVLDDSKTGGQRVLREVIGTVVDPMRGVNRLFQGKMWRVVPQPIYQKEPLSLSIAGGVRQTNDGTSLSGGPSAGILNLRFTYGDPYEVRFRKPFDYFRLRMDFNSGDPKSIIGNVVGDGFLFGGNTDSTNKMKMLFGVFQHYDYWNTDSFEIGTIGFGPGAVTKLPLGNKGYFHNEIHIAGVPLAGNNNGKTVQSSEQNTDFHAYSYSGGAELKYETALNWGWGEIGAEYYFYWLHTYVGEAGTNQINILRPRISVKLLKALNVGFEYLWYNRNDFKTNGSNLHITTGEQRIYLQLDFVNF